MATSAVSCYFSAGANRYSAAADWGDDGIVAFGADCNVCIWNPADTQGITRILSGHTAHVRAVKFLPRLPGGKSTLLVTGGDDKTLKVWSWDPNLGTAACIQTLEGHTAPINCIAALKSEPKGESNRRIFVSGAADATVKVWTLDSSGETTLVQTVRTVKGYFPLAMALSWLGDDGKAILLAVAGTTSVVQLFAAAIPRDDASLEFSLQATLSGHENWVRSLDFAQEKPGVEGSDLLLASASQDKYIRLWRIHKGTALSALSAVGVNMAVDAMMPGNKIHKLNVGGEKCCIMFEALLLGHEDWIYNARWSPTGDKKLQLLSASADNSLSIWESDPESGIWITIARLGEVSREKGATTATGSIGGFWIGLWSPLGNGVITLGRTGSWRRWDYDSDADAWKQNYAVSGHTRAVTGISWSHNGAYLLSTSSDQTTRLHGEWVADSTWHELSRPQIHGYDLNCIDWLSSTSFVSGADEKLMRVFTTPKAVAHMLQRLTSALPPSPSLDSSLPDAANMPVLGLSNKAIDVIDDDAPLPESTNNDRTALDPASAIRRSALDIDHPPYEESLSRHTLWPEVEKLYGHGYELSCLASSHDGRLIASACRASSLNHAVVRLFETAPKWTEVRPPLTAHSLTVTRLRFSGDDKYLLSVGRDRQWAVFERQQREDVSYELKQSNQKGHSRMILDAVWAPTSVGDAFATAGRDKQVKIWVKGSQDFELGLAVPQEHAVTALDFSDGQDENGTALLAVGTESGRLVALLVKFGEQVEIVKEVPISEELWLPKAVLQLAWRPVIEGRTGKARELAVAGEDGSLRIYTITF
ncbi:hypothetical protein OQA88_6878 [Cercophora sp. LCS_1]